MNHLRAPTLLILERLYFTLSSTFLIGLHRDDLRENILCTKDLLVLLGNFFYSALNRRKNAAHESRIACP